MSISDLMAETEKEEKEFDDRNRAKCGNYDNPENGCPNCGRARVMKGDDGKHRCEKCAWCIEGNCQDTELFDYLA